MILVFNFPAFLGFFMRTNYILNSFLRQIIALDSKIVAGVKWKYRMNAGTKEAPVFDGIEVPKPIIPFPDFAPVAELVDPDILRQGDVRGHVSHDYSVIADRIVADPKPPRNGKLF